MAVKKRKLGAASSFCIGWWLVYVVASMQRHRWWWSLVLPTLCNMLPSHQDWQLELLSWFSTMYQMVQMLQLSSPGAR
jgi:hypothetical protein